MKRGVGKVRLLDGKLLWGYGSGFKTGKTSIWYKYQQIATWRIKISIPGHLEDKESDT